MPAIPGMIATASSPAARATALLTPDADPANRSGAASSTVAVSGETVSVSPRPNTIIAGSTSASHVASGPMRSRSSSPHADTSGPMVIGSRGPMRPASAPDPRREQEHDHRERQQRGARGDRAEPGHGLQLQHQHEEHDAQRPVDEQRGERWRR